MNGSGRGKFPSLFKKKIPSNTTNPLSTASPCTTRSLILFLGLLVVTTLLVDSYLLSSTDFSWKKIKGLPIKQGAWSRKNNNKQLLNKSHHHHHQAGATVKRPWTRRHFKFEDQPNNDNLPVLEKSSTSNNNNNNDITAGREPILKIFQEAGIPPLNDTMIQQLPTWQDIIDVIGPEPVVGGLETCEAFKQNVPAVERMLGSSGMFNTGTNLVTHLLKGNCKIPERLEKYGPDASKEMHGMRWQVPWGKHSPAKYKEEHSTEKAKAINKEWIMPVVTIRHPYSWMKSMCKNGYTAKWVHGRRGQNCPNLKIGGDWNEVTTRFAEGRTELSDSLAHLWNDWYKMYLEDANYPRIIVRLEDLMFHAKATTTTICECVGGKIQTDHPFKYVLDSAKADSRGHDTSTGFVQAWIKYSKPMPPRNGFSRDDYEAAREALNEEFMNLFHYKHPPPN